MYQKGNKELRILALYLADYTTQFYLREISKLARLPLKTTQNIVFILEQNKILKSNVRGKNKYFRLNLENIETRNYLLQTEICKANSFMERYPAVKTFLKSIKTNDPIIVFGSFAKGTAGKDSDMDILIISNKELKLPLHLLGYTAHIIRLSEKAFIKAVDKQEAFTLEIGKAHVILNNSSVYVNTLWNFYGNK